MNKRTSKKNKVEYWQSFSDIMSVLVLVLILILIIIFTLFFELDEIGDNEKGEANIKIENTYETTDDGTGSNVSQLGDVNKSEEENAGGGSGGGSGTGGGKGSNNNTGMGKYEDPPVEYTGVSTDKAAVYVVVIDGETKQVIREAGTQFRLHTADGSIKTLSAYYPEKMTYESFVTTKAGSFYLPEQIALGAYSLSQLSQSEGYDAGKNLSFELKRAYEWAAPYVIHFPIYPSKNIIKIHIADKDTGEAIPGGVYQIVAAEDITTLDGTVRVSAGEIVDTVSCDENGYAQSKELFLGSYEIVQKNIPDKYVGLVDIPEVILAKRKDEKDFQTIEVASEKTKVNVAVRDELHDTNGLDEVVYILSNSSNGNTIEYVTDRRGGFEITNLQKNTTYYLTEVEGKENYLIDEDVYEFRVDEKGLIEDCAIYELNLFNRKIRVKIKVSNAIFNLSFVKPQMYLQNENGDIVHEWTGNHLGTELEGIAPGKYLLGVEDNSSFIGYSKSRWITIQDKADIQKISFRVWSVWSILACLGIVITIVILIMGYMGKQRNTRRRE